MFRVRQRTKGLIYSGLIGAGVIAILFAVYALRTAHHTKARIHSIEQKYETEITSMKNEAAKKSVTGWAPVRTIPAGHSIQPEDVQSVVLPVDSIPGDRLTSREQITGKIAKVSLQPLMLLTESLLVSDEPAADDVRWREMSFIQLPEMLKEQDAVDIRIQFPTGQDYILLSKKKIQRLVKGTITVHLNELEILSLSSAIVDAYMNKASIYAITYVEPQLQSKAIPTYPTNKAVLELIKNDPNIVGRAEEKLNKAARETLEQTLLMVTPMHRSEFAGAQAEITPKYRDDNQ